jgi:iron(III) transport system ATP-binding protein
MPEITVEGLELSFGSNRVLNAVGFTLRDREVFTLLGPSGCGKTTTLMSVAGFLRPDNGAIRCDGTAFFDSAAKAYLAAEDRNIGVVFQSYAIWPHMTVLENVAFPLKVRRVDRGARRSRAMETLDLVELADYAGRYPHELSGGQQQRVALARALVYSPSVLLLDEPFSNLDAKLRERARVWLTGLQRELGLTTLFVTHDQDEALSLSDRVAVMDHGAILQIGPPREIYRQPGSRFVAEFLGHCNILTGELVGRDGETDTVALDAAPHTLTIPRNDARIGDRIEIMVRPEAITVYDDAAPMAGTNVFPVKVASTSFLGDHLVYELSLAGTTLTATSAREITAPEVNVHIPPAACHAIPQETPLP